MTNQRPTPPELDGLEPALMVHRKQYDYLKADRAWALDEIDRLVGELEAAEQHVKILREQVAAHEPPHEHPLRQFCTCPAPGTSNSKIDPMCPIAFPHPWERNAPNRPAEPT